MQLISVWILKISNPYSKKVFWELNGYYNAWLMYLREMLVVTTKDIEWIVAGSISRALVAKLFFVTVILVM